MVMQNMQQAGGASATAGTANGFSGRTLLEGDRYRLLDRRSAYYRCTQHAHKGFDFDGRIVRDGGDILTAVQPLISAESYPGIVPLSRRRPSAPYRLGRTIVQAFTGLLFGENRFPKFLANADLSSQDYAHALSDAQQLPQKMIRARNMGGASGSVALSWAFIDGKPKTEVHDPKNIWVHEWADRSALVPAHVIECFHFSTTEWDYEKRQLATRWWWHRRDWTPTEDITYLPVPVVPREVPVFFPDPARSFAHNDGICHFTWGQNLPSDDVDGEPDYEGLYEGLDQLDILLSVISRGATLNLDPTLVLKMDPEMVTAMGVKKGSGNGLTVGEGGDASYLELAGTSIQAGTELFLAVRKVVLEAAQCVILDPDEITANGTSSVAMKALYRPMTAKCDIQRQQYGGILTRHLEAQMAVARHRSFPTTVVHQDGQEETIVETLDLPPRVQHVPPTPENQSGVIMVKRDPGQATDLEPEWPEYFPPTPQDVGTYAGAMSAAAGGRAVVSQATATELTASFIGRDGDEERARMARETAEQRDQQMAMFGGMPGAAAGAQVTHTMPVAGGGQVKARMDPPSSEEPPPQAPAPDPASTRPAIALTPQIAAALVTVDEARLAQGLHAIGGEIGGMLVAEYLATFAPMVAKGINATGGKLGVAPADQPKPPPGAGGAPFGK